MSDVRDVHLMHSTHDVLKNLQAISPGEQMSISQKILETPGRAFEDHVLNVQWYPHIVGSGNNDGVVTLVHVIDNVGSLDQVTKKPALLDELG